MSTFRVAFDGKWQEDFDTFEDALEWAREVSLTGRETWVIERRGLSNRFLAAFPEDRTEDLEDAWHNSRSYGAEGVGE